MMAISIMTATDWENLLEKMLFIHNQRPWSDWKMLIHKKARIGWGLHRVTESLSQTSHTETSSILTPPPSDKPHCTAVCKLTFSGTRGPPGPVCILSTVPQFSVTVHRSAHKHALDWRKGDCKNVNILETGFLVYTLFYCFTMIHGVRLLTNQGFVFNWNTSNKLKHRKGMFKWGSG